MRAGYRFNAGRAQFIGSAHNLVSEAIPLRWIVR
jgi:hypothetical protein